MWSAIHSLLLMSDDGLVEKPQKHLGQNLFLQRVFQEGVQSLLFLGDDAKKNVFIDLPTVLLSSVIF